MDEAVPGVGKLCGSSFLDRRFDNWLANKFVGYNKWTDDYHADAMDRWESEIKRNFSGDPEDTYVLPARGLPNSPSRSIRNGVLEMTLAEVTAIFEPIISKIVGLVKDQITAAKAKSKDVKAVLLAGGFGSNVYLKLRIKEAVGPSIDVRKMKDRWVAMREPPFRGLGGMANIRRSTTAIVQGALIQGLADHSTAAQNIPRPTIVRTRFAPSHIGTIALEQYDPEVHGIGCKTYVDYPFTTKAVILSLAHKTKRIDISGREPGGIDGGKRVEVMRWLLDKVTRLFAVEGGTLLMTPSRTPRFRMTRESTFRLTLTNPSTT